jgi:SOS-response transcriptional repressor LexA
MPLMKALSPEWSRRILALRAVLGLTQAAFASRLHYSAMALSRWERGTHEPSAQAYIQLGNLAGDPECHWFWARAGLISADFSRMLAKPTDKTEVARFSQIEIPATNREEISGSETVKLVAVPVLAAYAATAGEPGDQIGQVLDLDTVPTDDIIAAPNGWCPNPASTTCLRVRGISMSPLINDGDIIAVDSAQTNPELLSGKIVVTWQKQRGLVVSRFLCVHGLQLLEWENREYERITLGKNRNWRIIGCVLWWVHRAP